MFRSPLIALVFTIGLTATARAQEDDAPSETDLMYKAVRQWRGDSAESKVVDRVMADSQRETEQNRRAYKKKIASMFWRDPFSDQPRKLIPVRPEDRETMASQGGDSPKVLKELVAARADAAMARAEAAKYRADLARAEAVAARAEAIAARQACSEVTRGAAVAQYHAPRLHVSSQARHVSDRSDREFNSLVSRRESRRPDAAPAAAQPAPEPVAAQPVSTDPRGIIIIPITATIPKSAQR
jgi:hypothetical protein